MYKMISEKKIPQPLSFEISIRKHKRNPKIHYLRIKFNPYLSQRTFLKSPWSKETISTESAIAHKVEIKMILDKKKSKRFKVGSLTSPQGWLRTLFHEDPESLKLTFQEIAPTKRTPKNEPYFLLLEAIKDGVPVELRNKLFSLFVSTYPEETKRRLQLIKERLSPKPIV